MKTSNSLFISAIAVSLFLSGCQLFQPGAQPSPAPGDQQPAATTTTSGGLYSLNMSDCGGFSAADASSVLGIPAGQVKLETNELYEGTWSCIYSDGGDYTNAISFTVSHEDSVQDAIDAMDQYRYHLEIAGGTVVGEGLENGAYSDVMGFGEDDAVWTDINETLLVRKGNITIQFILPNDKMRQLEAAKLFMGKF